MVRFPGYVSDGAAKERENHNAHSLSLALAGASLCCHTHGNAHNLHNDSLNHTVIMHNTPQRHLINDTHTHAAELPLTGSASVASFFKELQPPCVFPLNSCSELSRIYVPH